MKTNLPQGEAKKYFLDNLLANKYNLFPPFIEAFSAGHYTTNAAESINNIIRRLRRSSELTDEIKLHFDKLPSDISEPNIRLKSLLDSSPIFSLYKDTYTDYA